MQYILNGSIKEDKKYEYLKIAKKCLIFDINN